jgi:hypothetical protein
VASGKYRKTRNFQLQHEDKVIEGDRTLKEYITSYYKDLFGPPKPISFSLDESRVDDIEQVSQEENDLLTRPFTIDDNFPNGTQQNSRARWIPDAILSVVLGDYKK